MIDEVAADNEEKSNAELSQKKYISKKWVILNMEEHKKMIDNDSYNGNSPKKVNSF